MLPIYNPATGIFANTGGIAGAQNESPEILLLNILVELRVANLIALNVAQGNFNVALDELRIAVVTESVNPSV